MNQMMRKFTIDDLCTKITDGAHFSPPEFKGGQLMASSKDMTDFGWDYSSIKEIPEDDYLKLVKGDCKPLLNDILIIKDGNNYLKHTFVIKEEIDLVILSSIAILRPDINKVFPLFLQYLLRDPHIRGLMASYVSGAAIPRVVLSDFKKVEVKIPILPTQKKIASILSAYDDLIENNNQRIKLLEEMAEEIYTEWFVRLRFPATAGRPGYQDCKFFDHEGKEVPHGTPGALPEGWVETRLGEVCEIQMGQSPKSEFYNEDMIGLPFHQGVTNFKSRFPSHKTYCTDPKRIAEYSDILLSVRAPVGRINIANTRLIIGRGLSSIRHKKDQQNYLYYLLKDVFKQEDSFGNGAVFNAVSKTDLEKIKVIRSKDSIETKFQELIKPFDDEINVLTNKNQVLQETRDLLLPRLISGKLDVSKLTINEPENLSMAAEPEGTYQMDNRTDAWKMIR